MLHLPICKNDSDKKLKIKYLLEREGRFKEFARLFYARLRAASTWYNSDDGKSKSSIHDEFSFSISIFKKPKLAPGLHTRLSLSPQELPANKRRLDSLARLIQGDEICVAVCVIGRKFYVATNRSYHSKILETSAVIQRRILERINSFKKYMEACATELLNKSILSWECKRTLLLEFIKVNLITEMTKHGIIKRNGFNQDDFEECLKNIFAHFLSEQTIHIKHIKLDEICDFLENKNYFDLKTRDFISEKIQINLKDFRKLESFFFENKDDPLMMKDIAREGLKIEFLNTKEDSIHAEMRILHYLEEQKNAARYDIGEKTSLSRTNDEIQKLITSNGDQTAATNEYIGISKLCCPHCRLAILMLRGENSTRGFHGILAKWEFSDFILSPNNLKIFLGEEAYNIYNQPEEHLKKGIDLPVQVNIKREKDSSIQKRTQNYSNQVICIFLASNLHLLSSQELLEWLDIPFKNQLNTKIYVSQEADNSSDTAESYKITENYNSNNQECNQKNNDELNYSYSNNEELENDSSEGESEFKLIGKNTIRIKKSLNMFQPSTLINFEEYISKNKNIITFSFVKIAENLNSSRDNWHILFYKSLLLEIYCNYCMKANNIILNKISFEIFLKSSSEDSLQQFRNALEKSLHSMQNKLQLIENNQIKPKPKVEDVVSSVFEENFPEEYHISKSF